MSKSKPLPRCFMDFEQNNKALGRIIIELFYDITPKTCDNFRCLCLGNKGYGKETNIKLYYKNSIVHRVIKNFMIQMGDIQFGNGKGGESIYGSKFDDENFILKHDEPYLLSMANAGANTNGSQFFITVKPTPHLNGKHVVFGKVIKGMDIVDKISNVDTNLDNDRPIQRICIKKCGELVLIKKKSSVKVSDNESESNSDMETGSETDSHSDSDSNSDSDSSDDKRKRKKRKRNNEDRNDKHKINRKKKDNNDSNVTIGIHGYKMKGRGNFKYLNKYRHKYGNNNRNRYHSRDNNRYYNDKYRSSHSQYNTSYNKHNNYHRRRSRSRSHSRSNKDTKSSSKNGLNSLITVVNT